MATLNKKRIKKRRIKRLLYYGIFIVLFLILVPEMAYVIHQVLSNSFGKDLRIDFNYIEALEVIKVEIKVQQLALMLSAIFVLIMLYLSMQLHPTLATVDTVQITPEITIPVAAGNGQYGNARFLNTEEKRMSYINYKYSRDPNSKMPLLTEKGGLVVDFESNKQNEIYYYIPKDYHSLTVATTGSGKTRSLLLPTMMLQMLSGISLVTTDVKGELWCYTNEFASKHGYKVNVLDFRNPELSMHYNFLQPIIEALDNKDESKAIDSTWDLVSVLVGEPKGEPLWTNGECAVMAASILAVAMEAPPECRNMTNVFYFIAYMCRCDEMGNMAISRYFKKLQDDHPAKICFSMAEIAHSKTRGSFFSSALGTLKLFVNPSIASLSSKSDFKLEDIGKQKTMLYIKIPDEKKTYYPLVSLILTQTYMALVTVANENGQRLPVSADFNIDEAGNCPYMPIMSPLITAGRSRGMRGNLVVQDYQQIHAKYKEEAETIISNCNIKVFLKGDSEKTIKSISEGIGKYTVEVSSASSSVSDGKRMNANYSSSANLTGRSLMEPADIKRIKPPHALVMVTGEYSAMNFLPDISKTKINALFGMGDEDHNRKLIMERESQIEKNPVKKVQLWGIWNRYVDEDEEAEEAVSLVNNEYEKKGKKLSFLNFSEE